MVLWCCLSSVRDVREVRVKAPFSLSFVRCVAGMTILTAEEKKLLTKAANLMDELRETLEVVQDKKLVRDLKEALREAEEGKAKPIEELVRELDLENEI